MIDEFVFEFQRACLFGSLFESPDVVLSLEPEEQEPALVAMPARHLTLVAPAPVLDPRGEPAARSGRVVSLADARRSRPRFTPSPLDVA